MNNDLLNEDFFSLDIVGIDEVGYGCWAGPVYVCALKLEKYVSSSFNKAHLNELVFAEYAQSFEGTLRVRGTKDELVSEDGPDDALMNKAVYNPSLFVDSKSISHKKRVKLASVIRQVARWNIGIGSVQEINEHGLAYAYRKAIERAIEPFLGERMIMDGRLPKWMSNLNCTAVIKGDSKVPAISAASIIAKVSRDALMDELAKEYPEYGFAENKGYGTAKHIAALKAHGFCAQHRTSYDLGKYLVNA